MRVTERQFCTKVDNLKLMDDGTVRKSTGGHGPGSNSQSPAKNKLYYDFTTVMYIKCVSTACKPNHHICFNVFTDVLLAGQSTFP